MMMKARFTLLTLTLAAAALLILVAAAPASAATQQFRDQGPFSIFVPCANGGSGESVDGIVKAHFVFGETDDSAGGAHFHVQIKLQGVGIGSVTGDSYRIQADIPIIFYDRLNDNAGGSSNISFDYGVDAIGQGDAPNFHGTMRFQGTMNANGEITMEKNTFTETCN
ncbi:MAG TPA: hypothetical protein VH988_16335 [Thermoanaerobaculia bacterium]|jgi:hypothetical protein|nr:hypothetical protein [Thermoanaerobaculia bacterium]